MAAGTTLEAKTEIFINVMEQKGKYILKYQKLISVCFKAVLYLNQKRKAQEVYSS